MDVFLDFRSLASSPDEATVAVDGESFGASRAILTQVLPSTVLAPSPSLLLCRLCLQPRCASLLSLVCSWSCQCDSCALIAEY